jgi:glycosyltransferase involved in cell wall biosynthesis
VRLFTRLFSFCETMRIAIDGRYIQDHFPGIGRYAYSLIRAMAAASPESEFLLYYNPAAPNHRFDIQGLIAPNVRLQESNLDVFSPRNLWSWRDRLAQDRADVFFSPYYLMPVFLSCPSVVVFHDIIARKFPQYLSSWRSRAYFRFTSYLSTRRAPAVVTDSVASKHDLMEIYRLRSGMIPVVYPGVDKVFRPQTPEESQRALARFGLPERFVLYFGINKPHKNLPVLIRAWKLVVESLPDEKMALVIGGHDDPRYREPQQEVERLGLGDKVRFLGDFPENLLPFLYSSAEIFAFPSLYEGFGLPPLEAMACGTPVICSNSSSLPEVTGDAAILLPPCDEVSWSEEIVRLLSDSVLRGQLRDAGLKRAGEFSWERSADKLLEVFERAAGSHERSLASLNRTL